MCARTAIPRCSTSSNSRSGSASSAPISPPATRRGATRDRGPAAPVPVRAAPYDQAGEIDRLDQGAEFFICARTQDQRWFGIVYDQGGRASERCGVDGPVAARRDYLGPCAAGWVPSARVRLDLRRADSAGRPPAR